MVETDRAIHAVHYMLRDDVKEPPHGVTQQELIERFSPSFELVEGYIPPAIRIGLALSCSFGGSEKLPPDQLFILSTASFISARCLS